MPVITLTLSWEIGAAGGLSEENGWKIEVCGNNDSLDLSSYKFVRTGTAPFHDTRQYVSGSRKGSVSGLGPIGWVMTQEEEPMFGVKFGAKIGSPPMGHVTRFLAALGEKGYVILSSHSKVLGDGSEQTTMDVWTLGHRKSC